MHTRARTQPTARLPRRNSQNIWLRQKAETTRNRRSVRTERVVYPETTKATNQEFPFPTTGNEHQMIPASFLTLTTRKPAKLQVARKCQHTAPASAPGLHTRNFRRTQAGNGLSPCWRNYCVKSLLEACISQAEKIGKLATVSNHLRKTEQSCSFYYPPAVFTK